MMWFLKLDLGLTLFKENDLMRRLKFKGIREEFLCQEQETHLQLLWSRHI